MTSETAVPQSPRRACTRLECPLRQPGPYARSLASLLLQSMSEGSPVGVNAESGPVSINTRCALCAKRVKEGHKALKTAAEWKYLETTGHWHYRRERKRRHWGCLTR